MSLRILPPANSQERLTRQRGLGSLRQQGLEVRAFAQFFWTMSRGLEYQDAALKDIFNLCLDNPLPQWEMEQLRILDFWNFSNYVHHRKDWQILSPPESTCTDQPTVTPSLNQDHVPPIPSTLKRRLRRKRAARNAVAITVSAESTAVTAEVGKSTPLFPELVENATVTPESVESVPVIPKPANPEAFKSSPVLLELVESTVVIPESVKSSLAFPESVESAPEPAPVREPTEPAPVREPTEFLPVREPTEPAPVREPTEPAPVREPTESAPEPAPVWLPTELVLASHVMPTESSPASRTMPTEIIPELLVLPVMASVATLKQSAVIVSSMDDTEAIPKQPAFTATGSESAPVLQTLDSVFESASIPDPTLPSRSDPELFTISESAPVPESLESALEFALVSDFAPVPEFTLELAPVLEPPKSILESTQEFISEQVPVQEQPENIPESISEPVPVQKQSVSQSPNQKQPGCIPEPLPSESSTLSVSLVIGKKAVPCLAPRSPELPTFSISGVMASESTPKPILSPEPVPNAKVIPGPQAAASTLPYSTIFKPPLFKPVNNPRYTTHVSPTPSSMQPNTVFPPLQQPSTLPCQATTLDLFPTSPPPLLGCMVAMALLCLLHSSPPSWYPLCSLLRHHLPGLVWMPGGIHWEGGTVRALPWQPCLCCLYLMFLWLSCVLTHCFVFVCVYHVFLWSHLLVSLGHAPLFSPCLVLVSLTVLTWPSCAFLPLYCAVFLLCLRVRLVP